MKNAKCPLWRYCLSGLLTGLVNGFFGAGGGMLLVPLLTSFCRVEDKKAFATSVAVILPICLTSLAVYLLRGSGEFAGALPYLAGGLLGGAAGGLLFGKVKPALLHRLLGTLIVWGGLRLVLS
ncbi:MAG: sulfite exporter TauE/SafE family protein [Oscillospiraceae bacterium]|nr:sulfite exporter TauE/SafE family protein [Oscillospiraceae bacterium]